jgi:hypothetical protein
MCISVRVNNSWVSMIRVTEVFAISDSARFSKNELRYVTCAYVR